MARKKSNATPAYTRRVAVMTRSKKRAADVDAAMRVLGLPELLEQILLFAVSDQMPTRDERSSETLKLSPMPGSAKESRGGICIFSLQRVSKDFHATINGSAKLKRLVYLAPYPNKDLHTSSTARKALLPFHTPLLALLDKLHQYRRPRLLLRNWQYNSTDPMNADDGPTHLSLNIRTFIGEDKGLYEQAISQLAPGWWNPEANWRQIKVCNAEKLVSSTLRIFYPHFVDRTASHGVNLTWVLQGDESLGYVFDLFCKLLQLIDETRTAVLIIERNWETAIEEASARFKSRREARGHHKISSKIQFAHRRKCRKLRSKLVHELKAEQKKLESAVRGWELSVKRKPGAQEASGPNEK